MRFQEIQGNLMRFKVIEVYSSGFNGIKEFKRIFREFRGVRVFKEF